MVIEQVRLGSRKKLTQAALRILFKLEQSQLIEARKTNCFVIVAMLQPWRERSFQLVRRQISDFPSKPSIQWRKKFPEKESNWSRKLRTCSEAVVHLLYWTYCDTQPLGLFLAHSKGYFYHLETAAEVSGCPQGQDKRKERHAKRLGDLR